MQTNQHPFSVIIPARLGSTRLKQKLLLPLQGKPVVQHTYEQALKSEANRVVIATDDAIIAKVVEDFGGEYVLTNPEHQSGTDRLSEACQLLGMQDNDIIVNVQGDEPLISPNNINQVAHNLFNHNTPMATLCESITSIEDIQNPNCVKVVFNQAGLASYFSRAPIPFCRDGNLSDSQIQQYYRHIGIYAYRSAFLQSFTAWAPCFSEQTEKLEQLRALYYGAQIHVAVAKDKVHTGIDVAHDLQRIEMMLTNQNNQHNQTTSIESVGK